MGQHCEYLHHCEGAGGCWAPTGINGPSNSLALALSVMGWADGSSVTLIAYTVYLLNLHVFARKHSSLMYLGHITSQG